MGNTDSAAIAATLHALRQRVAELEQSDEARRRAEDRFRFLAQASALVADSIDYEQTLASIPRLTVPFFADWCIVDLAGDDGEIQRLSVAHADPLLEDVLRDIVERFPPVPGSLHPASEVLRRGQSKLIDPIDAEVLDAIAHDAEHRRLLDAVSPRSGLTVPLIARGHALGAIELVRSRPGWRFEQADVVVAEELARRAAVAVDNARLYQATSDALRRSEEMRAILETVLTTAPVGFSFLDRDLRHVRLDEFLARMNGLTPDDEGGQRRPESLPEVDEQVVRIGRHVLESGEPMTDVATRSREDDSPGDPRHLFTSYYPIRLPNGSVLGVGALSTDITARRKAEDRLRFLAEASAIIAGSLDYEETLARVARLAVPFLADWCVVYLSQPDGSIRRLTMEHADAGHSPVSDAIQQRFPMNPDATEGVPRVIRTGDSLLYPDVTAEILAADAFDPQGLIDIAGRLDVQSWICVPMTVSGRTIGAISCMTAESGRWYGPDDLALAEDLGRRAAVAVENARLYSVEYETRRQAEQNAERIGRLQSVTAALSGAITPAQVADVIVNQGLGSLGAQRAMVSTLTDDGRQLQIIGSLGHSADLLGPWQTFSIDASVPAAEAVRTREPVVIESPEEHAARYPNLARERGISVTGSLVSMPLMIGDRVLGTLGLSFSWARTFDDDDRAFLTAIARQCAQALDRATAYEEVRAAVRAREQFLSIASHELKTPLTSIKASGQLIERCLVTDPIDHDRILRFSNQMKGEIIRLELLVNDLLDASRIQQDRLDLRLEEVDLVELARIVVGRFEHVPIRKPEHALIVDADSGGPITGFVDPGRIDQVLTNLVSNALKYSPSGGEIRVRISENDGVAVLSVHDQGIGLSSAEQKDLFLPFVRGEEVRQYIGGAGLGLFISAEIVERHGGSIVVESEPGHGSTFIVYLPHKRPADA